MSPAPIKSTVPKKRRIRSEVVAKSNQNNPQSSDENESENEYFNSIGLSQGKKLSSNTMNMLPTLDITQISQAVLQENTEAADQFESKYLSVWPQWKVQLELGYSLVFWGLGSKKKHLERFVFDSFGLNHHIFIFNGFFPNASLAELSEQISTQKAHKAAILIHNAEAISTGRGIHRETLETFLMQHSEERFKLILSVDHMNAGLMLGNLPANFLSHELHTLQLYAQETSWENSIVMKTQGLSLRALRHILSSLTANAKALFKLLADSQLAEAETQAKTEEERQISAQFLFQRGKEDFLFSNEVVFRTLPGEFLDHKVIVSKRNAEGMEVLSIPMDADSLRQFRDELE